MTPLQWLAWRQWKLRPWRAALSVLSVAIAVAAMLGTSIARSMVHEAYDAIARAVNGQPTLDLVAEQGGRFSPNALPTGSVPGVKGVVPLLFRGTILRFKGNRARALVVGVDEASLRRGFDVQLVEGQFPTERDGAIIERALAEARGIKLGDKLTVLGRRGPRTCYVRGVIDSQQLREFAEGASLVLPLATAQDFFGLADQIDRGRVFLDSREVQDAVRADLSRRVAGKLLVRETPRSGGIAEETLRSAELALYFSTALSLVMSVVVVLNTLRMNFHERRRELAIMRAIGASQRQIGWLLGLEGILAGVLGAAVGIPLGVLLAYSLSRVLGNLLLTPQPFAWPHWSAVVGAVAVGEVAVVASILWTRWGVERIPPAEAMRELDVGAGERPPWRLFLAAVGIWLVSLGLLAAVRNGSLPDQLIIPAGLLMLASYVSTLPMLLPLVLRAQGWFIPRRWWLYQLLSASQLARRPVRLGMTAGVMVVAISSGLGLGSAIVTHIQEVRDWYRRTMSGDYFLITAGTADAQERDAGQLREEIAAVAGVRDIEAIRFLPSRTGSETVMCVVRDFRESFPLPWTMDAAEESRLRKELAEGRTVVSSVLARRLGISVGGTLVVEYQSRNYSFEVAGLVSDFNFGGLCLFLQSDAARRRVELGTSDVWIVRAADDARDSVALRDGLNSLARENGLYSQSFAEVRRGLDQMMNGIVAALWTLIGIGFVVSGLGIANTLAMQVSEQTREIGLLRVVGMSAGRVRRLVVFQAALLGGATAFLGSLAGMTTGLVIHWCGEPLTGRSVAFEIPPLLFVANVGGAVLVTVVAAVIPAWRASRLQLAKALAYD